MCPSLPGTISIYVYCSRVIISITSYHARKCPFLDDKYVITVHLVRGDLT